MRTLFLIGQGLLLAFVVFVMPACHGDLKTIEIRALLSDTVVPDVSSDIQTVIEIAIKRDSDQGFRPHKRASGLYRNPRRDVLG